MKNGSYKTEQNKPLIALYKFDLVAYANNDGTVNSDKIKIPVYEIG